MPDSSRLPDAYVAMLARDRHHHPPAFAYALDRMFEGIDWSGKRVLEIGSGRGLLAIYMAMQGAGNVVSMEPEMVGATSGVIAEQRARIDALGLRNVEVVAADFNTWDAGGRQFDIIVSNASLNHLHQSDCNANHHQETFKNYLRVAMRIRGLLAPGGLFVAADGCRYGFFTLLRRFGVRRPWQWKKSGVDWRHHQNPGTWKKIFREAGYSHIRIDYPTPYRLRFAAPLVNTAIANFFLGSSFILRARR